MNRKSGIILAAAPGSASHTLLFHLEKIMNCKAIQLKSDSGIGHVNLNIDYKKIILEKLKLNFFFKEKLVYGHIFPTNQNLALLKKYYSGYHTIITVRNIYSTLNYLYKWNKKYLRGPLSFNNEIMIKKTRTLSKNYDIDFNLLLVLNFYKYWFQLIQNNLISNFTLVNFNDIIDPKKNLEKKILNILGKSYKKKLFKKSIKKNFFEKKKFKLIKRHKEIIKNFVSFNKEINFELILK